MNRTNNVTVRSKGDIEKTIRRFTKKTNDLGILKDYMSKQHFVSDSEQKRLKRKQARQRQQRIIRDNQ